MLNVVKKGTRKETNIIKAHRASAVLEMHCIHVNYNSISNHYLY